MNLLELANPAGLWWALLAIPIGLLYILKIRLRRQPVSTLLFWDKLFDEKKPRSWWQKLRHLLSLLLQLAFLGLLVGALIDPLWSWQKNKQRRIVLIVDNSASMNAIESVDTTRLDLAKETANKLVRSLRDGDRMAILSAGGTSNVAIGMTDHQRSLHDAIETLPSTEGPTDVRSSVSIADRLLVDEEQDGEIIVITDGCFDDVEQVKENTKVTIYGIGTERENIGITRYQVRRSLLDAIGYQVLVDVTNFSDEEKSCRVELNLEDELIDVLPLTLEPGATQTRIVDHSSANGGLMTATLNVDDALATDNTAFAVLPKRDPVPITLVSNGNLFLKSVLESIPLVELTIVESAPTSIPPNGILVIDQDVPKVIPKGRVVVVQPNADCDLWKLSEPISEPIVAAVDEDSDLTKHVRLDNVLFPDARTIEFSTEVEALIKDPLDQPLLAKVRRPSGDLVVLNCSLEKGDLPLRIAFPVLMKNSVEWFQGISGQLQPAVATGKIVSVEIPAALIGATADSAQQNLPSDDSELVVVESAVDAQPTDLVLISPSNQTVPIAVSEQRATIGPLLKTGLWSVDKAPEGIEPNRSTSESKNDSAVRVACNLTDKSESNLRPRIEIAGLESTTLFSLAGRSLWFYLTSLAAGLVATEWWLYQRRIVG